MVGNRHLAGARTHRAGPSCAWLLLKPAHLQSPISTAARPLAHHHSQSLPRHGSRLYYYSLLLLISCSLLRGIALFSLFKCIVIDVPDPLRLSLDHLSICRLASSAPVRLYNFVAAPVKCSPAPRSSATTNQTTPCPNAEQDAAVGLVNSNSSTPPRWNLYILLAFLPVRRSHHPPASRIRRHVLQVC